jgi:phage baseplate assembly protein W
MARATRQFIDLDAAFGYNPRTRDVATKTDDNAVRNALRNLIYTKHYERPFQPDLGCQISNLLFENMDPMTLMIAERVIEDAITKFEPRLQLIQVTLTSAEDNDVYINIEYRLKNSKEPQLFTTKFTRVR